MIKEMEALAGLGMETVDPTADLALSRIAIAHQLSPQVDEDHADYIEGLKPGEFFDATLGIRHGKSLRFVPVAYRKRYVEWGDRKAQEGIISVHVSSDILDECQPGARRDPSLRFLNNGNEIRETAYFFGWLVEEGTLRRTLCYIAMSSTQLRRARNWMTLASSEMLEKADGTTMMAPLFWRIYNLTTRKETNAQGSWYSFNIARSDDTIEAVVSKSLPIADIINEAVTINNAMDEHPLLVPGATPAQLESGTTGSDTSDEESM